jgi:hypothetical protein
LPRFWSRRFKSLSLNPHPLFPGGRCDAGVEGNPNSRFHSGNRARRGATRQIKPKRRQVKRARYAMGVQLPRHIDLRSQHGRRFRRLVCSYVRLLGGPDGLTPADHNLIRQLVGLQIRSEQLQCAGQLSSGSADLEVRTSSELRRVQAEFRARADELADLRVVEARRADRQQPVAAPVSTSWRAELAKLMGIDLEASSINQRIKLDRAVTLRLFVQDQLAIQEGGGKINVKALAEASKMLDDLLPAVPSSEELNSERLKALTDRELKALEYLLAKLNGSVEDMDEFREIAMVINGGHAFRIELVSPRKDTAADHAGGLAGAKEALK